MDIALDKISKKIITRDNYSNKITTSSENVCNIEKKRL